MSVSASDIATAFYQIAREQEPAQAKKTVRSLVATMVGKKQGHLLPAVLRALPQVIRRMDAGETATIESARELSAVKVREILAAIGMEADPERTETVVDPSLMGGVRVRAGGMLFDATIKGKIERLGRALRAPAS